MSDGPLKHQHVTIPVRFITKIDGVAILTETHNVTAPDRIGVVLTCERRVNQMKKLHPKPVTIDWEVIE